MYKPCLAPWQWGTSPNQLRWSPQQHSLPMKGTTSPVLSNSLLSFQEFFIVDVTGLSLYFPCIAAEIFCAWIEQKRILTGLTLLQTKLLVSLMKYFASTIQAGPLQEKTAEGHFPSFNDQWSSPLSWPSLWFQGLDLSRLLSGLVWFGTMLGLFNTLR